MKSTKQKKLTRGARKFQFKNACGQGEVITAYRNSYEDGVLFEHEFGISRKDWEALVKWVEEKRK